MPPPDRPERSRFQRSWAMTTAQRRLLVGVMTVIVAYVAVRLSMDRSTIPDPQPPRGDHWTDLADRLDPNTADWTELAALPNVGEKRARAIVAHRDAARATNPNAVVYAKPEDLYAVSGIGVAMVEQLKPYLRFDPPPPTTQP